MPKVGIVMGSDSDLKVMSKAASMLEKLGIDYEMTIISAHRMPDTFFEWAKAAEGKWIKVIIAGAGMPHIFRECALRSSRCRSSECPCQERTWTAWTRFTRSYRCRRESR